MFKTQEERDEGGYSVVRTEDEYIMELSWDKWKTAGRIFLNLMLFLAILAIIGCSIYVSILAFPAIAAALSAALVLTSVSPGILTLIALLPLLASIAVLLRFLQIQWEISKLEHPARQDPRVWEPVKHRIKAMVLVLAYYPLAEYFSKLFQRAFVIGYNFFSQKGFTEKAPSVNLYMNLFFALPALGLGIFLTVKILPTLLAAVLALGVPFPVAVLFAAAAAVTLIVINHRFLALPLTLVIIGVAQSPENNLVTGLKITGTLVGMGLAIALSTVFYPVLVSTLSTLLTPSMAGFTAVALCVVFTLALSHLLANVGKFIADPREFLGISKNEKMDDLVGGMGPQRSITDFRNDPTKSTTLRNSGGNNPYQQWNKTGNDNGNYSHPSDDSEPPIFF